MTLNERIAHREVLSKTHQRIVNRRVAVRVVSAEHVADGGRALAERLVMREVVLVHCVEDPAVNGLETVAHVRQSAPDYNAHRVLDIAVFHLAHKLGMNYVLLGKSYVLGFVILVLTCHFFSGALAPLLYIFCVNTVSRLRSKP